LLLLFDGKKVIVANIKLRGSGGTAHNGLPGSVIESVYHGKKCIAMVNSIKKPAAIGCGPFM
jgi:hypothetical protein